jgi:hypothetical protein
MIAWVRLAIASWYCFADGSSETLINLIFLPIDSSRKVFASDKLSDIFERSLFGE